MGKRLINLGKNAIAFLIGAALGAVVSVRLAAHFWLPAQLEKMDNMAQVFFIGSLDILFMVVLFGILGIALGGVCSLVLFHAGRRILRKG